MNEKSTFVGGLKCLFNTWIPHIVTGILLIYITFSGVLYIRQLNSTTVHEEKEISPLTEQFNTQISQERRPHIVLGILSGEKKILFRDTQRNTWIKSMLRLHKVLPFKITYKFLLDEPSSESIKENDLHKDIVYLNVSHHGRAVKFGEKMYVWWKYIHKVYPDALMGARIDDDAFVCVPQMFHRLNTLKAGNLYYGWRHGKSRQINRNNRVDEMFLVLGKDLISLVSNRTYCGQKKCKNKNDLIDIDFGDTSLAEWLSVYSDKINFKADNDRIVQCGANSRAIYKKFLKPGFCDKQLVFHKSTCEMMNQLHSWNNHGG
ncbi:uncharacterized protein LOC134689707 [Mytilus trossulus]|uniref:uncharacterized protein LOC134689707 n=1 Tax=Mytilus trossulus TaxID=6551 RepID=UPI003006330F